MLFTKTCLGCGHPFETPSRHRFYCAGQCHRAHENELNKARRERWSPERRRAGQAVQSAVYHGALVRRPCEVCGKTPAEAHHDDYAKPLDVRWLCRSHHKRHHDALRRA